ncbi:hypothetical protein B0H16DRAFT_1320340 [Mycena metata]|uniref:CCHC-type domain-containing protein n=1 Tax=Mycena metata TaxID=1033252 RepID=A0AAD7N7D3_9AGAR|nr:hypothetical protein B0H16DRAFT_1320340 [Mycena metata]
MEGATFVGAKKLANGGVVFDCVDEKMADWVKARNVMIQFTSALGGTCTYRPRRQELVVEMVPFDAHVEDAGTWRMVERESGQVPGCIEETHWIKPPQFRSPTQKVGHMKVSFATAEGANHAIDNGLWLGGVCLKARKPEDEARRCARCQSYDGHLARDCKAAANACARCAGEYRTADCMMVDSSTFSCANCKVTGHGAADRSCPVFQKEQTKKKARDPTAGYRYFPTADPRTWANRRLEEQAWGGWPAVLRGKEAEGSVTEGGLRFRRSEQWGLRAPCDQETV